MTPRFTFGNTLIIALVGAIIGVVLGYGFFHRDEGTPTIVENLTDSGQGAPSTVGTTFNTAKVAEIIFSPSTGTATNTSIYNSDATDRIVTDTFVSCSGVGTSYTAYTGAGLANWIISAATSSDSTPNTLSNANLVMVNNVSTSTADAYAASTTIAVGAQGRKWAAGSYMTFSSNATNTATCAVGVHYIGS